MTEEFTIIDKEDIALLKFPTTDVLNDVDEIKTRISDINRALSLGNLEHSKIKIFFEDDESKKIVDTTVWGVTDKNVMLKQGVMIPIHRIYKLF
jgi:GH35 family endo-1,4-beta-xylanase